jgi:hypothetical protein
MKSKTIWGSVYALGLLVSVVPAAIAVISRYGLFNTEKRVSVFVILLLMLCCVPFFRQIKVAAKAFIESPSIWGVWTAIGVFLWLFRMIADDMLAVCYIAIPSSYIGSFLMSFSKKRFKGDE